MNTAQAEKLATKLMHEHGLTDWTFRFDNAVSRFGLCSYRKKEISLSKQLVELNSEAEVRDVILHEIAHAIAPKGEGHGRVWKETALAIGCSPTRIFSNKVNTPERKYTATCKSCGRVTYYHRKRKLSCGECSPRFNKKYLLKFKLN